MGLPTFDETIRAGGLTLLGGLALKAAQWATSTFFKKRALSMQEEDHETDYEKGLRKELRDDLAKKDAQLESFRLVQQAQFDRLQAEVTRQELALDEWKNKYWELFQRHSTLEAQLVAIRLENDSLRKRVDELINGKS